MVYRSARILQWGRTMGNRLAQLATLMLATQTTACLFPIPASPEEEDGGVLAGPSYPVVFDSNPAMPGPIAINIESPFPVSLALRDANVRDTMYVRVFRDYAKDPERGPVADRSFPNDAETGTEERLVIVETHTWCLDVPDEELNLQVVFEVMVADRPFSDDPTVQPAYKAVTGNGRFSKAYWLGRCIRSSPF
jgi:hypothetical protein